MPEGKLIDNKYVMFGEPVNDKVLNVLKRNSPTASEIIGSLPPSVFEETEIHKQMEKEKEIEAALLKEKEQKQEDETQTLSKKQLRLMRKQGIKIEEPVEEPVVEKKKVVAPSSTAGNILKSFMKG